MKANEDGAADIAPPGTDKQISKLSIVIISQYFYPENFGINAVATALADRNHDVTALTGIPNYPSGIFHQGYHGSRITREYFGGVKIVRVPILPRGKNSRLRLALNYLSFFFSASILGPFLISRRPSVIIVNQLSPATSALPAIVLKLLTRSKILLWVQDLWPDSITAVEAVKYRPILNALNFFMKGVYRNADIVATQSRSLGESIAALCSDTVDIRYLPNSADRHFQRISISDQCAERKLLRPGFNIVIAGNMGIAQDLETVVRAMQLLRDEKNIQWTFLGDGSRRSWLAEEIRRLGLQSTAQILGPYPSEQMPAFFAAADALLVSLRAKQVFARTIPTRLQAYLACGKPILASVEGESERIIRESGAGLVSHPNDRDGLAKIALSMSRLSYEDRAAMGDASLRYYKLEFDLDRWIAVLEGWLSELSERD